MSLARVDSKKAGFFIKEEPYEWYGKGFEGPEHKIWMAAMRRQRLYVNRQ